MTKLTDQMISREFTCPRCKSTGADVNRIAVSGTGISRFMDIQHQKFLTASCFNCGYTEIYNLKILEGEDRLGTLLDIFTS